MWNHFKDELIGEDGIKRCSCIHCGKLYHSKRRNETGNMTCHLVACPKLKTKGMR